ncbi:alpha/beta hydrolase [Microbacterium pumilum]|uniref:Alpha/beta hydrolase fold-3 domain-containing protein n=1 Tax=Microbacterium pumilum TaxID=344165 RepID=A0ABN2S7T3_9MICO
MTDTEFDIRSLPFPDALRWLRENGEPADPRTDIDTASLRRRFPRLASVTTTDLEVDSPHGPQPARLYRDASAPASGRGLVWVHGGAFIGGYLDMPESNWVALELAARGIPVFAVDYTKCLGDVHFPVPSDDVLAAWDHARSNAQELLGVTPDGLVLGGASAGGTLTAGAIARLRDAGRDVPAGIVSVYPAAHPDGGHPGEIPDPASPMTQIALNYAGSAELLADPHVFPGLGSGEGFPPTLVVVCELDGLRPSGEAFAALLADAGVDVAVHFEPGADHAHINEPADPTALPTIEAIADWIGGRARFPALAESESGAT